MAIVGACGLCDGLAIGYLLLHEFYGELLIVLDTPFEGAEVEFSLTFHEGLLELFRLLDEPCGILFVHAGEDAGEFLGVALGEGADGTHILRSRIFDEVELIFAALFIEGVAGADIFQFHGSANVAGLKLVDRIAELTAYGENLSKTFLAAARYILEVGAGFERTAHHLEVTYLTDVRLNAGLEKEH